MAVKAKPGQSLARPSQKSLLVDYSHLNCMVKQSIISGRILDYGSGADDEVTSDTESMRWIRK